MYLHGKVDYVDEYSPSKTTQNFPLSRFNRSILSHTLSTSPVNH